MQTALAMQLIVAFNLLAPIPGLTARMNQPAPCRPDLGLSAADVGPWETVKEAVRDLIDECVLDPLCTNEQLEAFKEILQEVLEKKAGG